MSARPLTSRRTALGGTAAGLAALAGCDLSGLDPRGGPDDAPAASGGAGTAGGEDRPADVVLVSQALTELAATAALVSAVRRRYPRLAAPLQPALRTHRSHAATLTGASGDQPPSTTARAPDTVEQAWRRVRAREQRLQRRLAGFALGARSGALAGLLASMSAAVAQQLAVLPTAPPSDPAAPATGGG